MSRSEPGKGEHVRLWVMGLEENFADDVITPMDGICRCGGIPVEDFADCMWPVVVKAKLCVSKIGLARYLIHLATDLLREPYKDWTYPDGELVDKG